MPFIQRRPPLPQKGRNSYLPPFFDLKTAFNEFGYITTVSGGIAEARGILNVKSGELVKIYPSI